MYKLDNNELIRLYQVEDLSLRELGVKLGVDKSTVKRRLQKLGIPIVNKVYKNKGSSGRDSGMWRDDINESEIIHLFNQGNKSIRAIAEQLGVDKKSVKRRLELNGITPVRQTRSDCIGIQAPMHKTYYKYQHSAKRRGYEFNLDEETFFSTIQQPCAFCGQQWTSHEVSKAGYEYKFTGLDRVESTKGYVKGNILPCCKVCNRMKSDMNTYDFVLHLHKVCEHLNK